MYDGIFFENGPNPMFILDEDTHQILAANPIASEVFGYTNKEFLSMNMQDLILSEQEMNEHDLLTQTRLDVQFFSGKKIKKKKNGIPLFVKNYVQQAHQDGKNLLLISCTEIQEVSLEKPEEASLEEKREKSNQYLNLFYQSNLFYLITIDISGHYRFANATFQKKFGPLNFEKDSFLDSMEADDRENTREIFEKCMNTVGLAHKFNNRIKDQQKIINTIQWEFVAICNDDGVIIEIQGIGHNISLEQSYMQRLKTTQEKLDNLLNTVDMVWSINIKNFHIQFVNTACQKITGYSQHEFYSENYLWFNIIHPDDQDEVKAKFIQLIKTKEIELEYRIYHKDDSIRYLKLKAILNRDLIGTPATITASSVDITSEKKSIELLLEREKFIDNILNTIPGIVYIHWPMLGKTDFLNQGILKLLRNEKNPQTKVPENIVADLCHPDDQGMLQQHYHSIKNEADLRKDNDIIIKTELPSGEIKWLMLNEVIFRKDKNEILGILGVATDITSVRKGKIELQKLSEELELAVHISQLGICTFYPQVDSMRIDALTQNLLGEAKNVLSIDSFLRRIHHEHQTSIFEQIYHEEATYGDKVSFQYTKDDGQAVYLKMMFSASREDDTDIVIGVIFDETEERKYEKKIREKDAEIYRTNQQVVEYKLMALQSVMNPHFIFNSLNSIQFLIVKQQREEALKYLTLFSELLRKVIDSAVSGSILLEQEVELLHHYLELEKLRFEDKFNYEIKLDNQVNGKNINLPPLLIQPFVENAIIHGINNKSGKGKLSINIYQEQNQLVCTIEDDGVGREKAMKIKVKKGINHKSVGMMLTKERLQLINKKHPMNVTIEDLYDAKGKASGTRVFVHLLIDKN